MSSVGVRVSGRNSVLRTSLSTRKFLHALAVALMVCGLAMPAFSQSVVLSPNGVVDFSQLNYGDSGSANFGAEAEATIDVTNALALLGGGGGGGGYLNVVDGSGNWLVQNMPVLPQSLTGSDSLSMRFGIAGSSDGTQVSSENLRAVLSATPQVSAPIGATSSYNFSEVTEDNGGVGPDDGVGIADDENQYEGAAAPGAETFNALGPTGISYQFGHPNVQAGLNQCAPASLANDLTWLKTQYATPITQPNNPGIGPTANSNTLVGVLDNNTGRAVTSRTNAAGVWPLNGTLSFIKSNNLQNSISVSYASIPSNTAFATASGGSGGANVRLTGTNDYSAYGLTATALGSTINYTMLSNLLYNGYAVALDEVGISSITNYYTISQTYQVTNLWRHYVQALGVGIVDGESYIIFSSDLLQTDDDPTDVYLGKFFPSLGAGQIGFNSGIEMSWLDGNQMTTANSMIDQVIALQAIPEPSTVLLFGLCLPALWWQLRRRRT